jgi:acetyltransferase-like isoleucine patch superfamily enzyme
MRVIGVGDYKALRIHRDMGFFRKLSDRLFYDPYHVVARSRNVRMGSSQLGPSFRIRFDCPRQDVALQIGNRCLLQNQFIFESPSGKITVGDGVFINSGTRVISRSSIEIGSSVMIAWGCVIYDHDSHSLSYLDRIADQKQLLIDHPLGNTLANKDWSRVTTAPIRICDYVWLGFDVVVLKGVTIGEGAIVGARAVVTKDVPPWTIVAGNPARVVKEIPPELRKQ